MKNTLSVLFILFSLTFVSCQKVIHVDLNSSSPQYVIEGSVVDDQPPYIVHITRSVNFDQDNTFPAVSGATVVITDKTRSTSDTLQEIVDSPGYYKTHIGLPGSGIRGTSGHTYMLFVKIGNSIFNASSTMPSGVNLDNVYLQNTSFNYGFQIVPVYHDPAGIVNYYNFIKYINGVQVKGVSVRNDILTDGQIVKQPLSGSDTAVPVGTNIYLVMQSIDSGVYTYFRTLQQTINQNSATPANPTTNITGGALGYFSAFSYSSFTITTY